MKYMIIGLFLLFAGNIYAQVRGTVKDSTGEAIPGANVFWMNTGQGVTTKEDGSFSITKPSKSHMLIVSFIGFQNDTIHVSSKNQQLDIVLRDGVELNEVNIVTRKLGTMKLRSSVMNEDMISSAELSRAACCNLGESVGAVRHLCADVDGKHPELSGSRRSLWIGICPRSVDAEHTGFQRNIFGEEWL